MRGLSAWKSLQPGRRRPDLFVFRLLTPPKKGVRGGFLAYWLFPSDSNNGKVVGLFLLSKRYFVSTTQPLLYRITRLSH
jgi:hypothetical protein